jgi:hypothetical protein
MREKAEDNNVISRRRLLAVGGVTLVGAALSGLPAKTFAGGYVPATLPQEWMKEVVLPPAGSRDPVALSVAESRFWTEQLMEHAKFFIMLMPGPELAAVRNQAESFQRTFADQMAAASRARLDKSNYSAFNRSTAEKVKPFAEWKRKLSADQSSGKIRSLVWSTFFDHTADEAEHLVARLDQFSKGDTTSGLNETARFWTQIMGEHADFVAHLLDPAERDLIMKAMQTSTAFHKAHDNLPSSKDPVERMVNDIIDFKVAAEKGIIAGKIKSIIHPSLADHVRREALKAADDLKRAA